MTAETENLVLEHLRRMHSQMDRIEGDIGDLKVRMSGVEQGLGSVQIQVAATNSRMDRFDERLARIERRLELHEPA